MSEGISCQRSRMRSVRTPSRDGIRSVCGRHSLRMHTPSRSTS